MFRRSHSLIYIVIAAVIGLLSLCLTNAYIESLVGATRGRLLWGPSLFRVLLGINAAALLVFGFRLRASSRSLASKGRPWPRAEVTALAALLLCATALRFWRLGSDLWLDEILTLVQLARLPLGGILTTFASQNQHMMYTVLAHLSVGMFGESAWALRLPSAILGILCVVPMYLLARRLLGSREAFLTSAIMVVSTQHVWFSQNARGYMGLLFFTLLATLAWLQAYTGSRPRWWFWYVAAVVCGMWMNLTMVFVAGSHFVIHVASPKRRWRAPYLAWLVAGSLTLQLYALSLPDFFGSALHESSFASEWTSIWWMAAEILRNFDLGAGRAISLLAVLAGIAIAAAGVLDITRRDIGAAAAMLLPALLSGACMVALGHNLWPRFFFFCMGFALIVVVRGLHVTAAMLLGAGQRRASIAGAALAGALILASSAGLPRYYSLPKQDYRGAYHYVERNRQAGTGVVSVGLAASVYRSYVAPEWPVAANVTELQRIQDGHDTVWLVYTLPAELKAANPSLWTAIQKDFVVVESFPGSLGGGQVVVCRNKTSLSRSSSRSMSNAAVR